MCVIKQCEGSQSSRFEILTIASSCLQLPQLNTFTKQGSSLQTGSVVALAAAIQCIDDCCCVCRGSLFYSKEVQQYVIPFMGSDPSVVRRTQRFLHEEQQQSPVGLYSSVHPSMHWCREGVVGQGGVMRWRSESAESFPLQQLELQSLPRCCILYLDVFPEHCSAPCCSSVD